MAGVKIYLADGTDLVVDQVVFPSHPNVEAALMDNEACKCAIVTQIAREECPKMVHLYKKLGVEAELCNTSLLVGDKHYNLIVMPTTFGENLFCIGSKRLAYRAVKHIISCGLNPLGAYTDEVSAMNNLINNLLFAVTYNKEDDCFMFPTPGNMVPMRPSHAEETRQIAKHLINNMFV